MKGSGKGNNTFSDKIFDNPGSNEATVKSFQNC